MGSVALCRYKKKHDVVHGLTGQFCDARREQRYCWSIQERVRSEFSLAVSVAAGVFGMFAIADYYLLGLTRAFLYAVGPARCGGQSMPVGGVFGAAG